MVIHGHFLTLLIVFLVFQFPFLQLPQFPLWGRGLPRRHRLLLHPRHFPPLVAGALPPLVAGSLPLLHYLHNLGQVPHPRHRCPPVEWEGMAEEEEGWEAWQRPWQGLNSGKHPR